MNLFHTYSRYDTASFFYLVFLLMSMMMVDGIVISSLFTAVKVE